MIFRRRRVRIEIEHSSLRMETLTDAAGFGPAAQPEPEATSLATQNVPTPEAAQAATALSRKQETRS